MLEAKLGDDPLLISLEYATGSFTWTSLRNIIYEIDAFILMIQKLHFLLTHFSSVSFHMEASHLFCSAKQMTGLYMKCNTRLKGVNDSKTTFFSYFSTIHTFLNFRNKKPIGTPKPCKIFRNDLIPFNIDVPLI